MRWRRLLAPVPASRQAVVFSCHQLAAPVAAGRFSIVGTYSGEEEHFVIHVALLRERVSFDSAMDVDVWHVAPPIVAGPASLGRVLQSSRSHSDVVADAGLTVDMCDAIQHWLSGVDDEVDREGVANFQQYCICPHMTWVLSESGRRQRRRFSCAGFVFEAYSAAGVVLVDLDSLPALCEKDIAPAYRELRVVERRPSLARGLGFISREDLGLDASGRWKVLLPGYLIHAIRSQELSGLDVPLIPRGITQARFPETPGKDLST